MPPSTVRSLITSALAVLVLFLSVPAVPFHDCVHDHVPEEATAPIAGDALHGACSICDLSFHLHTPPVLPITGSFIEVTGTLLQTAHQPELAEVLLGSPGRGPPAMA